MKTLLKIPLALLALVVFFGACKKDNVDDNIQPEADHFSWTFKGTDYVGRSYAVLFTGATPRQYRVMAGTNVDIAIPEVSPQIDVGSLDVGSYAIDHTLADNTGVITYYDEKGFILDGMSGTLNITKSADNKISGNFTAQIYDGASTSEITGNFSGVPVTH